MCQANLVASKEHAELLSSVRKDIHSYKTSMGIASRSEALLRERGALHGSERAADSVEE